MDKLLNAEHVPADSWIASVGTFLALSFLIIDQGGFFSSSCASTGIVALITAAGTLALRRNLPTLKQMAPAFLLIALSLIELASSAVNGMCVTTLVEALRWASLAPLALCCTLLPPRIRAYPMRDLLAWFFVAWSILGLLMYTQLIPLQGAMDGRLQFTFAYANAAAVFFGLGALVCASSESARLRGLACVPLSNMLATLSGGGIGVFLLVCLGLVAYALTRHDGENGATLRSRLVSLAGQGVFMVAALALAVKVSVWALPIGVCIAAIVFAYAPWPASFVNRLGDKKVLGAMTAVVVVAAVAVAALALPDRLAESSETFAERMNQVSDGFKLFLTAPVLGVGPDMWRYLFADIQTAYYEVNVVHCSLIQIVLDGGLLALAAYVAVYVLAALDAARLLRAGQPFALAAVALVALHLLVDFDLRFGALLIMMLLALESFKADAPAAADAAAIGTVGGADAAGAAGAAAEPTTAVGIAAVALMALSIAACVCALWVNSQALNVSYASTTAEAQAALEASPLFKEDIGCNESYLLTAVKNKDYDEVLAWAEVNEPRIPLQAAYLYMALQNSDRQPEADQLLATWKARTPFASILDVLK